MTIFRFLRETRAAAGIAGVLLTLMTLGGVAFVTDHVWLTYHRDLLKNAADAAVMATTTRLLALPASMSDDEVDSHLQPIADRHVRSNLVGNVPEKARTRLEETLQVDPEANRKLGTVAVLASADMGGTLLSKQILAYAGPKDGIAVKSGAEGLTKTTTELVLAIDVTVSMTDSLDGGYVGSGDTTSRISIVKEAAGDLIDVLASGGDNTVAVGIVPWNYRVRLNQATRAQWENNRWAVYPAERTYPHPTRGPPGADKYLPEKQTLPLQDRLPTACRAWAGCLDMRVVDSALRPSFSNVLPSTTPFLMSFFTDQTTYPHDQYVSYTCQAYTRQESNRRGGEEPLCYDLDSVPDGQNPCGDGDIRRNGPWRVKPQDNCGGPGITPLTTDMAAARNAVRGLQPFGSATYSSAGMAWAIRLLDSSWRDVWGHSVHPMDGNTDVQKVIVLLTDGEDNHVSDAYLDRRQGCTKAKEQGIIIYTIAAMHPRYVGQTYGDELRQCSSEADDPDGTYFFANNASADALKKAFADIGRQLISVRRTY